MIFNFPGVSKKTQHPVNVIFTILSFMSFTPKNKRKMLHCINRISAATLGNIPIIFVSIAEKTVQDPSFCLLRKLPIHARLHVWSSSMSLSFPAVPDARDRKGLAVFRIMAFLQMPDQNQFNIKWIKMIHYLTTARSQCKTSL